MDVTRSAEQNMNDHGLVGRGASTSPIGMTSHAFTRGNREMEPKWFVFKTPAMRSVGESVASQK